MFPTTQAERAADKVLDDILQKRTRDAVVARPGKENS